MPVTIKQPLGYAEVIDETHEKIDKVDKKVDAHRTETRKSIQNLEKYQKRFSKQQQIMDNQLRDNGVRIDELYASNDELKEYKDKSEKINSRHELIGKIVIIFLAINFFEDILIYILEIFGVI